MLSEPKLAGKITGMLLELPVEDLCHLLDEGDALRGKVQEAMLVLQQEEQAQQDQVQKDQGPTPMDEGAGREGGERPRSGGASPQLSCRRLDEDPPTPSPEREPRPTRAQNAA
jgi:hypothetical protein